jgi:hypothetical protein
VDDDRRGRALPAGALVLVGPAAVVEAGLAGEQLGIPVGVAVEHDQGLALEVHALEVVPLVLRRLDAVADEDQLGVVDDRLVLLHAAGGDELGRVVEGHALAALAELPGLGDLGGDADDREALDVRALVPTRLVAQELQGAGKVELGDLVAAARGPAAFQQVVGQEADGAFQGGAVDDLGRLLDGLVDGDGGRGVPRLCAEDRGDCHHRRRSPAEEPGEPAPAGLFGMFHRIRSP